MTFGFSIDRHAIALISIIGSSLDMLGALYLAYDLLGGEHGPLRTLTRAVTYGAVFGAGYGITLGPIFGLATGVTHGITLAWEYSRASRNQMESGFWRDTIMSAMRGCGFAVGAGFTFGWPFGITFGVLSTVGQAIAYRIGIRPTTEYKPAARPGTTRFQLLAAANRTVGYAFTGFLSSVVAGHRENAIAVGLKTGIVIGLVTAIGGWFTPLVEWTADHAPEKRMGVFGIALMLVGFTLQSVQYWVAFLDVPVR
jgi:hypothetical protein